MENNVPQLRFPVFQGKWEEKQYKDFYSFKNTNSFSRDKLNYENGYVKNIHYGDIHTKFESLFDIEQEQVPYINEDIDVSRIPEDCYLQEGDLVVADASEDYNDIGKTIEVKNLNDEKVIAGLHTFLARKESDEMAVGFASFLMKTYKVRLEIKKIAQGSKVLGISKTRLNNIHLHTPAPTEQTKIANFLTAVDKRVNLLQKKKDELELYKKGVMQKLFSQTIRFKDENDNDFPKWEEKMLGEVGFFYYGKSAPKYSLSKDAKTPCVRYGELYTKFNGVIDSIHSFTEIPEKDLKFSKGGEILIPRVGEDPLDFCKCSWLPLKDVAIGEMISVYNTDQYQPFIVAYIRAKLKHQFARVVEGGNVSNLYFRYLEKVKIKLPTLPEQKKIASFLNSMEASIDKLGNQIDESVEFKKGLLQKMFV